MDLAQKALIVQRSRYEKDEQKGVLMVTVNLGWTWGQMMGRWVGGWVGWVEEKEAV